MAKEVLFDQSKIIEEFTFNLLEHYDLTWTGNRTAGLYRTIFFTMAEILKYHKSKKTPKVGFILKDTNGVFKIGAILTYHDQDEEVDVEDDKGNYTLEITLNEEDMNDIEVVIDNHSDLFIQVSGKLAYDIMNGRFKTLEYCNTLFIEAIDTLIKFMDANATEGEEFTLVYNPVFTATSTIENGKKHISIVPGAMVKQYIKGDTTL